MEGCGGLVEGLEVCSWHVDVEAEAEDDGGRVVSGFGEHSGNFFVVDKEVVGPFDLGGDVEL